MGQFSEGSIKTGGESKQTLVKIILSIYYNSKRVYT